MIIVGTKKVQAQSQDADQLQDDHVEGEDVRVARHWTCGGSGALFPPSLAAHTEDEDEEREEEEEADAEGYIDGNAFPEDGAVLEGVMERGVGGGIDRHICMEDWVEEERRNGNLNHKYTQNSRHSHLHTRHITLIVPLIIYIGHIPAVFFRITHWKKTFGGAGSKAREGRRDVFFGGICNKDS